MEGRRRICRSHEAASGIPLVVGGGAIGVRAPVGGEVVALVDVVTPAWVQSHFVAARHTAGRRASSRSAGTTPGTIHPEVARVLHELGLDTSRETRSSCPTT